MPLELGSLQNAVTQATAPAGAAAPPRASPDGNAFAAVLDEAVQRVESYRAHAEDTVRRFLSGETEELHKVAIATQQAELSFDLFLQMKNRVVQAYQEVMRMQL